MQGGRQGNGQLVGRSMRLAFAFLVVWSAVAVGLYVWGHMTNQEMASFWKEMFFGLVTIIIACAVIGGLVLLF